MSNPTYKRSAIPGFQNQAAILLYAVLIKILRVMAFRRLFNYISISNFYSVTISSIPYSVTHLRTFFLLVTHVFLLLRMRSMSFDSSSFFSSRCDEKISIVSF